MKIKTFGICLVVCLIIWSVSCATALITRVDIQSFDMRKSNLALGKAVDGITEVFIDRGFDIKVANKELGLLTTEYKKFASTGRKPPFDYYMQIKAKLRVTDKGDTVIALTPMIKQQNRLNAAAFNEGELTYYTGEPEDIERIDDMTPELGWRHLGMTLFMNIVTDVAESFGLSNDQVIQNVTKTPEKFTKIKFL